jgi:hypothetical protein
MATTIVSKSVTITRYSPYRTELAPYAVDAIADLAESWYKAPAEGELGVRLSHSYWLEIAAQLKAYQISCKGSKIVCPWECKVSVDLPETHREPEDPVLHADIQKRFETDDSSSVFKPVTISPKAWAQAVVFLDWTYDTYGSEHDCGSQPFIESTLASYATHPVRDGDTIEAMMQELEAISSECLYRVFDLQVLCWYGIRLDCHLPIARRLREHVKRHKYSMAGTGPSPQGLRAILESDQEKLKAFFQESAPRVH